MNKNQLHHFAITCLVLQLTVIFAHAQEAVIAYADIKGAQSGTIKGGSTAKGTAGQIECIGFTYNIKSPHDPVSGQVTGKITPGTLVIVKHFDKATPDLMKCVTNNEVLTSVVITFYVRSAKGELMESQKLKLTNATISQISQYGGSTAPEKMAANSYPAEEITIIAEKAEF